MALSPLAQQTARCPLQRRLRTTQQQNPRTPAPPPTNWARWRVQADRQPLGPYASTGTAVAVQDPPTLTEGANGAPSSTLTPDAGPATSAGSPFIWTRHWWPLFPVASLRPDRPNAVTLLGIPLAVWRDGSGSWRVFKDACPHRLAPLSEGRVESDGSLSCSYHGWRFSGSGACSRIPQALDPGAEAAACSSRRACATAYPARVEAGMLWVWPDESPDAAAAAAASTPELTAGLRARGAAAASAAHAAGARPVNWFVRELPYSYEVLVENLLDPAHLPFSHHKAGPSLNRSQGGPMPMKPAAPSSSTSAPPPPPPAAPAASGADNAAAAGAAAPAPVAPSTPRHWTRPEGPDIELDFLGNIAKDATISFTAPHLVTYTYRLGGGAEISFELVATPVAPGRSRFFSPDGAPPAPGAKRPPMPPLHKMGLKRALNTILYITDPLVTSHCNLNTILDGDSVFLHVQDQLIRRVEAEADAAVTAAEGASSSVGSSSGNGAGGSGGLVWSRAYYLPTQADSAMLAARRWLEERAGGGPFRARARGLLARTRQAAGAADAPAHSVAVPGAAPSPADRASLLNRYEQHTRHCPACSERLQKLQRLAAAAHAVRAAALAALCVAGGAIGAVAALQGAAAAAAGWPAALAAAAAVLAAAATAVRRIALEWAQQFLFVDYVHADKD